MEPEGQRIQGKVYRRARHRPRGGGASWRNRDAHLRKSPFRFETGIFQIFVLQPRPGGLKGNPSGSTERGPTSNPRPASVLQVLNRQTIEI